MVLNRTTFVYKPYYHNANNKNLCAATKKTVTLFSKDRTKFKVQTKM